MDREISVTLTRKLILLAVFYRFRAYLIFLGILFLILICNLIPIWSHGGSLLMVILNDGLPFLFLLGLLILTSYFSYSKSIAMIRKMKTPVTKYRLTDDWFCQDSDLASGRTAWTVFKELRKYRKIWKVLVPSGGSHLFPTDQLDGELKAFLTAKLPKPKPALSRYLVIFLGWFFTFVVLMYFLNRGHH